MGLRSFKEWRFKASASAVGGAVLGALLVALSMGVPGMCGGPEDADNVGPGGSPAVGSKQQGIIAPGVIRPATGGPAGDTCSTDVGFPGGINFRGTRSVDGEQGAFGQGTQNELMPTLRTQDGHVFLVQTDGEEMEFAANGGEYRAFDSPTTWITQSGNDYVVNYGNGQRTRFAANGTGYKPVEDFVGAESRKTYSWNTAGQLTQVNDNCGGGATNYSYTAEGQVATVERAGRQTSYSYENGRLVSVAEPGTAPSEITWDANAPLPTQIRNPNGVPVQTIDWRADGQIDGVAGPTGQWTRTATTCAGAATSDADGNQVTRVVENGLVMSETVDGHTTDYEYNAQGRVTSVNNEFSTQNFAYDQWGNQTSASQIVGNTTRTVTRSFDSHGNLTAETGPDGASKSYTYDSHGFPTAVTDGGGNTTQMIRDSAGNVVETRLNGTVMASATFDSCGNPLTQTANGVTTSYTYTAEKRLASVTRPDGTTETLTYNSAGELTARSAPEGNSTYEYDQQSGRLLNWTSPVGGGARTYDSGGRVVAETRAVGQVSHTRAMSFAADGALQSCTVDDVTPPTFVPPPTPPTADPGMPDAAPNCELPDAGTPDAGTPDAGTSDAGTPDAGTPDAATPDAGTPDAGTPDAGTTDAG